MRSGDEAMSNQDVIKKFIESEIMRQKNGVVLSNTVSLIETGIIDSLSIQVLIAYLEKKFSIRITDDEIVPENFETIEAIGNLVQAMSKPSGQQVLPN
jgi:acyl carrier protein